MNLIFPQFYFQYTFDGHYQLKNDILEKYVNIKKFKNVKTWNCNSKTYYFEDMEDIQFLLSEVLNKFSQEIDKKLKISVNSAWINLYKKGDFQEIHHHLPNNTFSMVYFLNYDENLDGKFYFYNMNQSSSCLCEYDSIFDKDLIGDNWIPNVKEGDVIIFPSYFHHGVRPQTNNKKRITISCNFSHTVLL